MSKTVPFNCTISSHGPTITISIKLNGSMEFHTTLLADFAMTTALKYVNNEPVLCAALHKVIPG